MQARFHMLWMTTKRLPNALVRFARSFEGEGIILIGPEALMSVCTIVHALSLLHGPGKSMRENSMTPPSVESRELLQRQNQSQQRLQQQTQLQHSLHASANRSRETRKREQRKQQQAQAVAATQSRIRREGLRCRSAHAACCSPRPAVQPSRCLWGARAPC